MIDKLAAFGSQQGGPAFLSNGNTVWAQQYCLQLQDVVLRYAARLPRNVQRHLGPSELGHECDRQVVGKMAGVEFGHASPAGAIGNTYAWASIVGTAIHAFLEEAFTWDAGPDGKNPGRWIAETRVTPDPGAVQPHPGTADLFDTLFFTLDDHKGQSEAMRTRLRRNGPPLHYFIQLLLYAIGYMHKGYPVQRIVLISWPRTKSTLEDMYCWEKIVTNEDLQLAIDFLERTEVREKLAKLIVENRLSFWEVPAKPSDEDCEFCPFSNPAALKEGTNAGCPGLSLIKKKL